MTENWIKELVIGQVVYLQKAEADNKVRLSPVLVERVDKGGGIIFKHPYGKPDDLFWVRETWREALSESHECYAYRANLAYRCGKPMPSNFESTSGWKPSIHMKKAIARIWLECTSIGVERLQNITDEGAKAEGIENQIFDVPFYKNYSKKEGDEFSDVLWRFHSPIDSYRSLWESINGANNWNLNPYVWVVGIKKTIKEELNHETSLQELPV